jgi:archaellum component FlaC
MNHNERRRYAKQKEIVNRKFEAVYYPKVVAEIKKEISSLIGYMRVHGMNGQYFDNHISNPDLGDVIESLYKRVGVHHANAETRLLRTEKSAGDFEVKGFGFNEIWVNFITNYFKQHLVQYITFGAVETMRDYFLPIISKAITEGVSFDELARDIEQSGFEKYQAARIVRTEVNSAASLGTVAAGESYQYETQKEWISAADSRVRGHNPKDHADHWSLDGQLVDYHQHFVDPKNGVRLMQPGDPKAQGLSKDKAATIINCRCTVALVAKRDANGRLIPKAGFVKSDHPEETKDMKPDYSEITDQLNYLNDEVRDASRGIRDLKESDIELLETLEKKLVDQKHNIHIITTTKDELSDLFQQEMNVYSLKADELLKVLSEKEYDPEFIIDTKEFTAEVQRLHDVLSYRIGLVKDMLYNAGPDIEIMKSELSGLINTRFDELIKEVKKKRSYKFEVVKDSNDLIISATAQQI